LLGNFKLHRPPSLPLHDNRAGCDMAALDHIVDDFLQLQWWLLAEQRRLPRQIVTFIVGQKGYTQPDV
jgi:hypothetical protein